MGFIVAIDGPAGSGKGTVTKLVAEREKLVNIDTGAMYRCVALKLLHEKITENETDKIEKLLENIKIELKKEDEKQLVFLEGKNVTENIRTPEVDSVVAKFAALKVVREKMTPMQQEMGKTQDLVMEGRDIGTTVFPNADIKIYLDASFEERANRRYKQNQEKGIKCTYEEVLESIIERHKLETEREIAPLIRTEDAIYIDSSNLEINEVVDKICRLIKEKRK